MFPNTPIRNASGVFAVAVFLTACGSTPVVVETSRSIESDLPHRSHVHSVESVSYMGGGYGGAALRQAGHVHTMSKQRAAGDFEQEGELLKTAQDALNALPEQKDMSDQAAPEDVPGSNSVVLAQSDADYPKSDAHQKTHDSSGVVPMSMYDYDNWKRFCNGGEGLGKHQITHFQSVAFKELPKELRNDCLPPSN